MKKTTFSLLLLASLSITRADVTVTVASTGTPMDALINAPRQELAAFSVSVTRKPVIIQAAVFHLGTPHPITNLELYEGTNLLSGPFDSVPDGTNTAVKFTDAISASVGTHIYHLKGRLTSYFAPGEMFAAKTTPPSDWKASFGPRDKTTVKLYPAQPVYGQTTTAIVGSLSVSTDPTSPSYSLVTPGVNVVMGVYKIRAVAEAIRIDTLGLSLSTGAYSGDIQSVTLWDGNVLLGNALFTGGSQNTVVVLQTPLYISVDTDRALVVRANLSPIGVGLPGRSGDDIRIDFDSANLQNTVAQGLITGANTPVSGSTSVAAKRLVKSFPTVAQIPLPMAGVDSDGRLIAFSVHADAAGPIGIGKMSFAMLASGVGMVTGAVYGYTDSALSQPIPGFAPDGLLAPAELVNPYEGQSNRAEFRLEVNGVPTILEIPAGQTRYFLVRGGFSSKNNAYITTYLLTEEGSTPIATFLDLDQFPFGFFMWTPNSYGISGYAETDWLNSFGVEGMAPNGLSQTRTN